MRVLAHIGKDLSLQDHLEVSRHINKAIKSHINKAFNDSLSIYYDFSRDSLTVDSLYGRGPRVNVEESIPKILAMLQQVKFKYMSTHQLTSPPAPLYRTTQIIYTEHSLTLTSMMVHPNNRSLRKYGSRKYANHHVVQKQAHNRGVCIILPSSAVEAFRHNGFSSLARAENPLGEGVYVYDPKQGYSLEQAFKTIINAYGRHSDLPTEPLGNFYIVHGTYTGNLLECEKTTMYDLSECLAGTLVLQNPNNFTVQSIKSLNEPTYTRKFKAVYNEMHGKPSGIMLALHVAGGVARDVAESLIISGK